MRSLENFLFYLRRHPALEGRPAASISVLFDENYRAFAGELCAALNGMAAPWRFRAAALEGARPEETAARIDASDLFILFYDDRSLPAPHPEGPATLRPLREHLRRHSQKSARYRDVKDHFYEIYSAAPETIDGLHKELLSKARGAKTLRVTDARGTDLAVGLADAKP